MRRTGLALLVMLGLTTGGCAATRIPHNAFHPNDPPTAIPSNEMPSVDYSFLGCVPLDDFSQLEYAMIAARTVAEGSDEQGGANVSYDEVYLEAYARPLVIDGRVAKKEGTFGEIDWMVVIDYGARKFDCEYVSYFANARTLCAQIDVLDGWVNPK